MEAEFRPTTTKMSVRTGTAISKGALLGAGLLIGVTSSQTLHFEAVELR